MLIDSINSGTQRRNSKPWSPGGATGTQTLPLPVHVSHHWQASAPATHDHHPAWRRPLRLLQLFLLLLLLLLLLRRRLLHPWLPWLLLLGVTCIWGILPMPASRHGPTQRRSR